MLIDRSETNVSLSYSYTHIHQDKHNISFNLKLGVCNYSEFRSGSRPTDRNFKERRLWILSGSEFPVRIFSGPVQYGPIGPV